MLKVIKFKKPYRKIFDRGYEIKFSPNFNLLVGDQGCGKTTLLNLIRAHVDDFNKKRGMKSKRKIPISQISHGLNHANRVLEIDISLPEDKKYQKIRAIDLEKDLGNTGTFDWDNPFLPGGQIVSANFWSHGEKAIQAMVNLSDKTKPEGGLVLMDEPDCAMSIRSVFKIVNLMTRLIFKQHCQVIAAAHNPFFINCFENVYSVEHGQWITSEEFIKSHMKGLGRQIVDYTNKTGKF